MNRRHFLGIAALAGLGPVLAARQARALTLVDCATDGATPACRRLDEHDALLRRIDQTLADQGVTDPEERRALLAATLCPVCGMPMTAFAAGAF